MQNYLVEFFGTIALVLVILLTGDPLAIGVTLGLLVYLFGKVSGGAFNPAVSIALYFNKKLSLNDSMIYVILQVAAGITAYLLYKLK
jgi:aquaporin Z